jgi:hypothetical protein
MMPDNSLPLDSGSVLQPKKWVRIAFTLAPLFVAAIGYLIDGVVDSIVKDWIKQQHAIDPAGTPWRIGAALAGMLGFVFLVSLSLTAYLWVLAFRTYRNELYPPRGMPIISVTKVLRGRAAIREAYKLAAFGSTFIALYVFVVASLFRIFPSMGALLLSVFGQ